MAVPYSRRQLRIRGVDFLGPRYVNEATLTFGPHEIGTRIGQMSFEMGPGAALPFLPEDDDPVEATEHDGVSLRYTGKIKTFGRERILGVALASKPSHYTVQCQDWAAEADRINISSDFTITAGDNDKHIVESLLAAYWDQIIPASVLPATGHVVNARRMNMPAIAITQGSKSLKEALDEIAAQAFNASWYVDAYKRLHWNDVLTVAPYTLIDDRTLFGSPDWVTEVLKAGASALWPLTEPYGATFGDGYGGTALTASGAYAHARGLTALQGGGVELAGGRLDGGSGFNFDGTKSFSIGLWVRPVGVDAVTARLMSREVTDGGGAQGWLIYRTSTSINFARYRDGVADTSTFATALEPGRTYFVAATYDGTNMRLYVNGALVAGPTASSLSIKVFAAVVTIGQHSSGGAAFLGTVDEPVIADGIVWSAATIAAMYAAGSRKFVGYASLSDNLDGTSKAVRVTVIGTGGSDTVTDWPEYFRIQRRLASERNPPLKRMPQMDDVTDMNLTTSARRVQAGFRLLDAAGRRRTLALRTYDPGLYPGQQVDIIDADSGPGTVPYVSADDESAFVQSTAAILNQSKGRYYVQRVTPTDRGGENWEYEVEVGSYLPTFESVVGA